MTGQVLDITPGAEQTSNYPFWSFKRKKNGAFSTLKLTPDHRFATSRFLFSESDVMLKDLNHLKIT